jgi:hypothetical protein
MVINAMKLAMNPIVISVTDLTLSNANHNGVHGEFHKITCMDVA